MVAYWTKIPYTYVMKANMKTLIETEATVETTAEEKTTAKSDFVYCSVLVGENLNNRISRHIDRLKATEGPGQSRQRWVVDAIKEKLNEENVSNNLPRAKFLGLKISQHLHEQILKRVELMRKIRNSFSKKQWIIEAVSDKLDRDEQIIQKKITDFAQ